MNNNEENGNKVQTRIEVLGIPVDVTTMADAVQHVEGYIARREACLVVTANAEMIMRAQEDAELADIMRQAQLVVPDGAGVVWAARHQGRPLPERVAGYDLAQQLMKRAAIQQYRVFLLGAAPDVVEKAKKTAESWYPGIQIVGTYHGYFGEAEEENIVAMIQAAKPDILFAALGVPRQEKWLKRLQEILAVPVCIGVGGTLDVMAGTVKRAPLWMQKAGLEWSYRLLRQPQRVIRMMALPRFVGKVIFAKK